MLIDPNALKEVLSRVDRKALSVALKGTGEQLKTHFLQCMSQRGAEMLRERRFGAWTAEEQRHLDLLAPESAVALWRRLNSGAPAAD